MKAKENLNLKDLEKLHPVEREKVLKKLLSDDKNKKFFKLINEEIDKTQEEQEHSQSLETISKKAGPKIKEKELDDLVRNQARELEENETKKEQKPVSGKLYSSNEDDKGKYLSSYNTTSYNKNEHSDMKIEVTNTSKEFFKQEPTKFGEQDLSIESGIKKMTDLYKGKKKEEHHGH